MANKVIIKVATVDDLPRIYKMISLHKDEGLAALGIDVDMNLVNKSIKELVEIKGVLLGEFNGELIGGIAGYVFNSLFTDEVMFSAMFFYVMQGKRNLTREFLKEIEMSLLPTHINRIVISVPTFNPPQMGRWLQIMGYSQLETHYSKKV